MQSLRLSVDNATVALPELRNLHTHRCTGLPEPALWFSEESTNSQADTSPLETYSLGLKGREQLKRITLQAMYLDIAQEPLPLS